MISTPSLICLGGGGGGGGGGVTTFGGLFFSSVITYPLISTGLIIIISFGFFILSLPMPLMEKKTKEVSINNVEIINRPFVLWRFSDLLSLQWVFCVEHFI